MESKLIRCVIISLAIHLSILSFAQPTSMNRKVIDSIGLLTTPDLFSKPLGVTYIIDGSSVEDSQIDSILLARKTEDLVSVNYLSFKAPPTIFHDYKNGIQLVFVTPMEYDTLGSLWRSVKKTYRNLRRHKGKETAQWPDLVINNKLISLTEIQSTLDSIDFFDVLYIDRKQVGERMPLSAVMLEKPVIRIWTEYPR